MIEWRTITDFPDYEVSNEGNVRNRKTGKILSPGPNPKGYLGVSLNGHTKSVHTLVAKAFLHDKYREGLEVNHIYGIKNKNSVEDLEWTTHLENIRHAHRTGLIPHYMHRGGSPRKKVKILETEMVFESIHSCARYINGEPSHISECLSGFLKRYKGFHFEYVDEA